jgi:heptosyltransferase II
VVLTTGLLSALADRHGPVDVLVTPAARPLVETHPAVRRALTWDKRGADRGPAGLLRVAARMRAAGFDRAVLPHRSLRTALAARLAHIPERVGFADAAAPWLYTRRVPRPAGGHEAERLMALADVPAGTPARVTLGLTVDDRDAAYAWLAARGIGDGFTALAPGAIWGTKRWPGFPALARLLPGPIVVIGGPDDLEAAGAVVEAAPDRVASAAGAVPLRVSAALIERAAVLVSNDSAPLHLAGAVGTPCVAVFGPTVPAFGFGPRGAGAVVERTGLTCRPCSRHGPARCPLGHHRCMREIPADAVRDAIHALVR